ncbi:hypothetical protein ACFP2T_42940 [Plantactinospora solaniradicis]|uniref:IS110 family transposase n=1 Tax=Plantactinospora solaniradicis TaxID=1723736 RepID=A0ABW1KQT1_9ACTN
MDQRQQREQIQRVRLGHSGARAYYDQQRARGVNHHAALRHLSNRLVGILHGRLNTATRYDEDHAWPSAKDQQSTAAA